MLDTKFQKERVFIAHRYILQKMGILETIIREEIKKATNHLFEADKYQKNRSNELLKAVTDKVRSSDELMDAADNLGINMDWSKEGEKQFRKGAFNRDNTMKSGKNKEAVRKSKAAINLIRQFIRKNADKTASGEKVLVPGGAINMKSLRDELESNPQKYANLTFNEFMRIKDHLDLSGLRGTYDPTIRGNGGERFGTTRERGDEYLDVDGLDFNTISPKHIQTTRKLNKDEMADSDIVAKAESEVRRVSAEKYVMTRYGISMELPSVSLGNKKVKNAMIINFTSAFRCPAWDDCLVKHACYARSGEMMHTNVKMANDRRNLMWLSAAGDEKLMKMVHSYLMATLVSWDKALKYIKKNATEDDLSQIGELVGFQLTSQRKIGKAVDELSKLWCHELVKVPIVKEALIEARRVTDVRINENGDFINQPMLEEFDKYIAGEFMLIGVTCAAYSCRNLQFGKIEHIIVNASRTAMKNYDDEYNKNDETGAIQRYFVAVPGEMYDAFEDTFGSLTVGSDTVGSLGQLRRPMPLYDVLTDKEGKDSYGEIKAYYYKCPCARKDFRTTSNGEFTVNCYNCHMCYEKPSGQDYKKMFVFVKAHGSEKSYIGKEREQFVRQQIGVPKGYLEWRAEKLKKEAEEQQKKGRRNNVKESVEFNAGLNETDNTTTFRQMQDEGIKEVTNNAIMSMTQHFSELAGKQTQFNEMLERISKPMF